MIYYTSDLRKIELTPNHELIGEGTEAKVYKLDDDTCIKVYKENAITFDPEMFDTFKELDLNGYAKLYDLLYSDIESEQINAYTMKYYLTEIKNILLMPTEYTIHSFNIIYNSIKVLAENQIFAKDIVPVNVILRKDNITVIDFDDCRRTTQDKERVLEVNIGNLLYLYRRLFEEGIKRMGKSIDDKELSNYLNAIFSYSREPVKALERRLSYTKTPLEALPWKYRY